MTRPAISFVVLAYNGGDMLLDCVASVLAQTESAVECFVVDNGSTDGSVDRVAARFPSVRVIRSGTNLGYAAGMNRGMVLATAEFVVALNQDAVLLEGFATEILQAFAIDPAIGAVGGAVLRMMPPGTRELDSGGYFLGGRLGSGRQLALPATTMDVFGISGACPAFRRAMLDDLQLASGEYFDNTYFFNFEDVDLYFRAHLRGWRVVFLGEILARHHGSWSSGGRRRFFQKPLWMQRLIFRNRYFTFVKDVPAALLPRLLPSFLAAELLVLPFLLARRPQAVIMLARAWYDVASSWPRLWRARRAIQGRRTASLADLRALVRGF